VCKSVKELKSILRALNIKKNLQEIAANIEKIKVTPLDSEL
jgi:hypothetical protein